LTTWILAGNCVAADARERLAPLRGADARGRLAPLRGADARGRLAPLRGADARGRLGPLRGADARGRLAPLRGADARGRLAPLRGADARGRLARASCFPMGFLVEKWMEFSQAFERCSGLCDHLFILFAFLIRKVIISAWHHCVGQKLAGANSFTMSQKREMGHPALWCFQGNRSWLLSL